MNAIVPFDFEGASVRVIDRAGEPWFVLADVCHVMEIENPRNVTARLDDDEKGIHTLDTPGGDQNMTIINESGLYSLILTSRKVAAKRFKKWVTAEVLPTIRKTGGYGAPDPMAVLNDPAAMRQLLLNYSEKMLALEGQVAAQQPKLQAFDRIAGADGSMCITDAAKSLQMRRKDLFSWMSAHHWIYQRFGTPGYVGYQDKIQTGYLEHKVTTITRGDGYERAVQAVRVTPKGLAKLATTISPAHAVAAE